MFQEARSLFVLTVDFSFENNCTDGNKSYQQNFYAKKVNGLISLNCPLISFGCSDKILTCLETCLWNPGTYRHKIVRLSSAQFGLVMQDTSGWGRKEGADHPFHGFQPLRSKGLLFLLF